MSEKQRFCAICNCIITAERIDAEPKTELCVEHAAAIKKYGGEFVGTGERADVHKAGSMKRTSSPDVSVTWRRNYEALRRLQEDYEREQWEKKKQGS